SGFQAHVADDAGLDGNHLGSSQIELRIGQRIACAAQAEVVTTGLSPLDSYGVECRPRCLKLCGRDIAPRLRLVEIGDRYVTVAHEIAEAAEFPLRIVELCPRPADVCS